MEHYTDQELEETRILWRKWMTDNRDSDDVRMLVNHWLTVIDDELLRRRRLAGA